MDWSKAKKIMICAFVVVNFALLLTMLSKDIRARDYVTTREDVIERLSKIDVDLKTDIPKKIPSIELLEVEYEGYDTINKKIDIAREFLNSTDLLEMATIDDEKNLVVFEDENQKFEILKNKKLVYEYKAKDEDGAIEYDPHKVVSNFLKEKSFKKNDYKLTERKKNNDIIDLTYTKEYKDTIVEKTYMKFTIKNGKVIKFERLWLNAIEEKENNIKLRPATDSLLKLLSVEGIKGKTIENIVSCYYFDPNNTEAFEFDEFKSGDALPAWKVKFIDGTIKYLYEK